MSCSIIPNQPRSQGGGMGGHVPPPPPKLFYDMKVPPQNWLTKIRKISQFLKMTAIVSVVIPHRPILILIYNPVLSSAFPPFSILFSRFHAHQSTKVKNWPSFSRIQKDKEGYDYVWPCVDLECIVRNTFNTFSTFSNYSRGGGGHTVAHIKF